MTAKVYAWFYPKENPVYRTNTILQFGNSWNIIGAAVLANPGSATPQYTVPEEIRNELERITEKITDSNGEWRSVKPDPTIQYWLPRIFNGYFAHKGDTPLSGVILLYNLFNIMNQNFDEAVKQYQKEKDDNPSSYLAINTNDLSLINKTPIVYLGWGKQAKNQLKPKAEEVFSSINMELRSHYDPAFEKNTFYHPRAVNMGYKRWNGVQNLMSAFYKNFSSLKH